MKASWINPALWGVLVVLILIIGLGAVSYVPGLIDRNNYEKKIEGFNEAIAQEKQGRMAAEQQIKQEEQARAVALQQAAAAESASQLAEIERRQHEGGSATIPQQTSGTNIVPDSRKFKNKGRVVEVLNASIYSYMLVSQGNKTYWVAASAMVVKKGDMVRFPDGARLTNFNSKSLNRTFDEVIFVDKAIVTNESE